MPLVPLVELLAPARAGGRAVAAFNVVSQEYVEAVFAAAEAVAAPVIVAFAEPHTELADLELVAEIVKHRAARSGLPVALHLDHATRADVIMRAIRSGFTSIMYDGSGLPYEDNCRETRRWCELLHAAGISLEAELGRLITREDAGPAERPAETCFTDPKEAEVFARGTGVDALAVAFGTAHGEYTWEPNLDFDRLAEIGRRVPIPLVMHGGSGLPASDVRRAIELGVNKINFFTDCVLRATSRVRSRVAGDDRANYLDFRQEAYRGLVEAVSEKLRIVGQAERGWVGEEG